MCFGIAHDVEIDKFFQFHGLECDIFQNIHEEGGYIFSIGHVGDDTSDGLLFLIQIITI